MVLTTQIITVAIILLLGLIVFRQNKIVFKTKTLVSVSLLIVISLVLSIFSWMIPVFGFPALKVGFSQLPLMLAGYLFGPAWAFLAGLSSDILELLSGTISFPFFGFTLNKILVAMIPALVVKFKPLLKAKLLSSALLVLIGISALFYTFSLSSIMIQEAEVIVDMGMKLSVSFLITLLVTILIVGLRTITKNSVFEESQFWILSIILVELVVQLALTPIWLNVMYGIPVLVSISARLLKAVVMILLNALIGLFSLRIFSQLKLRD